MTKGELIDKMSKDAGVSKAAAAKGLDSFMDAVQKSCKKGNKVTLIGFGTFSLAKRGARIGRNPQTGEKIKIKASKTIKFTAGKALKESL